MPFSNIPQIYRLFYQLCLLFLVGCCQGLGYDPLLLGTSRHRPSIRTPPASLFRIRQDIPLRYYRGFGPSFLMAMAYCPRPRLDSWNRKRILDAHVPRSCKTLDVGILPDWSRMEYVFPLCTRTPPWSQPCDPRTIILVFGQFHSCFCALVRNTHGPGPDDVLLGEYNHKFDAD